MTAKQQKFVSEYVVGGNAAKAARAAGYSPKTAQAIGTENLQKPAIRAAIDEKLTEHAHNCGVTKEWIITRLRENAERALQAIPVLDKEGEPTGEYRYDGNVANRALELLGKDVGMFVERVESNDTVRILVD